MQVAIIGYGYVGKYMHQLFPNAKIYDKYIPQYNIELDKCDIAFIAVPTPCVNQGELDCSNVEEAIKNCKSDLIVIRSTTQPGFCDRMAQKYKNKRIVMQPEYLGETVGHYYNDVKNRNFIVLGGEPADRRAVIECYHQAYSANITIRQVSRLEAEVIKLAENRAAFYKIMQCQELYDVCESANIDYYTVRDVVYGDDVRFNLFWTFVYPNNRGANSKCIPKDVYAYCAYAESLGLDTKITKKLLEYNQTLIDNNSVVR